MFPREFAVIHSYVYISQSQFSMSRLFLKANMHYICFYLNTFQLGAIYHIFSPLIGSNTFSCVCQWTASQVLFHVSYFIPLKFITTNRYFPFRSLFHLCNFFLDQIFHSFVSSTYSWWCSNWCINWKCQKLYRLGWFMNVAKYLHFGEKHPMFVICSSANEGKGLQN